MARSPSRAGRKTGDDYAAIEAMAPPQGLDLAMGGVRPPLADPFVWTAEKNEEGGVRFSGFVPGELVRAGLTEAASSVTSDATVVADGAPDDFEDVRDRRPRRARNPAVRHRPLRWRDLAHRGRRGDGAAGR